MLANIFVLILFFFLILLSFAYLFKGKKGVEWVISTALNGTREVISDFLMWLSKAIRPKKKRKP